MNDANENGADMAPFSNPAVNDLFMKCGFAEESDRDERDRANVLRS
jgi:hypothetical protein